MRFYEPKVLTKEALEERFKGSTEYFNFKEVGWMTKTIDTITGWWSTKSKIYTVKDMIEVLADENKLIDAEFGSNIMANLINSIPKDEKKKEEKKDDKKDDKKEEKKKIELEPINTNKFKPSGV
jgi:hypothetical protein